MKKITEPEIKVVKLEKVEIIATSGSQVSPASSSLDNVQLESGTFGTGLDYTW